MLSLTIISVQMALAPADTIPTMVDIPGTHIRMSATEITNAQYEAFWPSMKRTFSTGDNDAVTMVSWYDAMEYCQWLSQVTGCRYRLPTEEEWELACRAGTTTAYNTGDTFPESQWKAQRNNRVKDTVSLQVAQFAPNAWGLYDMHGTIAGIHASVVELRDGSLMALGRGNAIDGRMPCSRGLGMGKEWTYSASPFPPIGSGQRLVFCRLQEGPLMLCSFGEQGLFVALSYDEGETWPVRKLLTDGKTRTLDGGAWTGTFTLDADHAEPAGYLACTQTPDGIIHLLSSRVHYRFNLQWVEQ